MKIGKLIIKFHSPVTFEIEGNYMREVKIQLGRGAKLQAIKTYKIATGKTLLESKNAIDALCPKYYKDYGYTMS